MQYISVILVKVKGQEEIKMAGTGERKIKFFSPHLDCLLVGWATHAVHTVANNLQLVHTVRNNLQPHHLTHFMCLVKTTDTYLC